MKFQRYITIVYGLYINLQCGLYRDTHSPPDDPLIIRAFLSLKTHSGRSIEIIIKKVERNGFYMAGVVITLYKRRQRERKRDVRRR